MPLRNRDGYKKRGGYQDIRRDGMTKFIPEKC